MGRIVIITGEQGMGKTGLCQALAERLREERLSFGGILSLAQVENGRPVGKIALDLTSGEERLLARRQRPGQDDPGRYILSAETLAWADRVITQAAGERRVLFIDEVGPAELLRGEGWMDALRFSLASGKCLIVTVRPSLLEALRRLVPVSNPVLDLDVSQPEISLDSVVAFLGGCDG